MENCRPLHPCSQHCGFGREFSTRTLRWSGDDGKPGVGAGLDGASPAVASYEYVGIVEEGYNVVGTEL